MNESMMNHDADIMALESALVKRVHGQNIRMMPYEFVTRDGEIELWKCLCKSGCHHKKWFHKDAINYALGAK